MSVPETKSKSPRGVLVVMMAAAAAVTWTSQVRAQQREPVAVVAGFADHKALSDGLKRRVQAAISGQLEARTGSKVAWTVMPEEWRTQADQVGVTGVTPEMCRLAKLDRGIQGLVLWVGYRNSCYLASCAVFHREFNDVIVSRTVAIVDRRLVVNNVKRLVHRLWRSVGEIVEAQGASLVVSLAGAGGSSTGTLPKMGSPLEVLRLIERKRVRQTRKWQRQFLVVRKHRDASTVVSSPVNPGQQDPAFFRFVGQPGVRYHVRSLLPRRGPTRIRVVSDSDGRPREGCAIYVSKKMPPSSYPTGPPDGLTDEAGFFSVPFRGFGFQYVTVACGFQFMTEPVASGQAAVPMVLRMSRNAPAKQSQAVLQRVKRRVKEVEDWLVVVAQDVNRLVKDKDEAGIEMAIAVLEQYSDWPHIQEKLEALGKQFKEHTTRDGRSGFDRLARDVRMQQERLSKDKQNWQTNIDVFKTGLRKIRTTRLVGEFAMARDVFMWRDAEAALEELAKVNPDDQVVRMLLARLRRALSEHSREHAGARRLARDGVRTETAGEVLQSWRDTAKAIRVLIREDDGPVLWEVLKGLEMSITLLADGSREIARKVAAAGDDLGDDERERLEDRSQLIKNALTGLSGASKDAKKLVIDFFNQ
jgi:hypothetical protein